MKKEIGRISPFAALFWRLMANFMLREVGRSCHLGLICHDQLDAARRPD